MDRDQVRVAVEQIVMALREIAGTDRCNQMASVQINTSGKCILRVGISHSDHLTIEQFVSEIEEACPSSTLNAGARALRLSQDHDPGRTLAGPQHL